MRTNRKRVPVPFLFRAADGLGADGKLIARAYGNVVEGVFTRAGQALAADASLRLSPAAHSRPRLAMQGGVPVLVVEGATTNYLLQSQTFDNASWSKTNVTVTANASMAPDGTGTADSVAATASAATALSQTEATISTTVATFSVYGRIGSGATDARQFVLYNVTTAAVLAAGQMNWSTGVMSNITGTVRTEDAGTHGGQQWWRIILSATTGITAGNDLAGYACFDGTAETATEHAHIWGAQLEASAEASSYVATTTVAATRVTDLLSFPFTLVPQAMTAYCRYVHLGALRANTDDIALCISNAGISTPRFRLGANVTPFGGVWNAEVASRTSTVGGAKVRGDVVEMRGVLSATGTVLAGESLNAAAETLGVESATNTIPTAWSGTLLWVGSNGTFSAVGPFAFTHICVALGTKTMAEMRDLAEVV